MRHSSGPKSGLLYRWALFAMRHRWAVLACWLAILAFLGIFVLVTGSRFVDVFRVPGTESQKMVELLKERFPEQSGNSTTFVFEAKDGVNDPSIKRRIEGALAEAAELQEVTGVISPYQVPGAISEDGTTAYATIQYGKPAEDVYEENVEKLRTSRTGRTGVGS